MARLSVEQRREQLVRAAIEVIAAEGIERASLRRIAEHAGASLASVHYAFRDKDQLLAAVVAAVADEIARTLAGVFTPGASVPANLAAGFERYWAFVEADRGHQLLQYELTLYAARTPGAAWLAAEQYARYRAVTADALRAAGAAEANLAGAAAFLVAGFDGIILSYLATGDRAAARASLGHLLDAVARLVA